MRVELSYRRERKTKMTLEKRNKKMKNDAKFGRRKRIFWILKCLERGCEEKQKEELQKESANQMCNIMGMGLIRVLLGAPSIIAGAPST